MLSLVSGAILTLALLFIIGILKFYDIILGTSLSLSNRTSCHLVLRNYIILLIISFFVYLLSELLFEC